MKAYSYDNDGRYVGDCVCQRDPVRSKREGKDVYLLPANATTTAPPDYDPAAEYPVWDGCQWTLRAIPVEPAPQMTPSQARESAYDTEQIIPWNGEYITVTEASLQWQYYAAEGSAKAAQLQTMIAAAKDDIRKRIPDEEA